MDLSVTLILVAVTTVTSFLAFNKPDVLHRYMHNPYQVMHRGQYYRLLTSAFLHGDFMHLLFNMIALFSFGQIVEFIMQSVYGPELGIAFYLLIYFGGVLVGGLPGLVKHKNNPGYNALGASGGVSSVVFASILFMPLNPIYLMFIPIGIPGFILGALYLIYSYVQDKRGSDNIGHDAHLFGAVFGVVITAILVPRAVPSFFEQLAQWSVFGLF